MVSIALLGHGVVGSGVVEVLTHNCESITKRAKEKIEIKYILDKREFKDSPFASKFTKNYNDILNDDDVKIVVEVMGGEFYKFDPSNSATENPVQNWVPEGYTVTSENDWYKVTAE